MSKRTVDVLVPVALDKAYSYRVPEGVELHPGDLTVHDGRLWHRVARSQYEGAPSLRRSMYLPYLTGPYEPKSDDSPTPLYHRFGEWMRSRRGGM